jgi:pimeloyl-ACP methyl ester carboxylesterase
MRPGNAWLAELERRRPDALAIPWLAIWSTHDNIVAPAASARLEGADELRLEGIGHLAMLDSPDVAEAVARRVSLL